MGLGLLQISNITKKSKKKTVGLSKFRKKYFTHDIAF